MRLLIPLMALCAAAPLAAQDLSTTETDILPRLIDSLCIDLHPSNGCEQVILLTGQSDDSAADLVILSDRRRRDNGGSPLLVLRDVVYNGSMWGMSPSLEEAEGGGVLVHSEQSGIGRTPWFQTLHVDWLDDAFRVLALSYSSYDRMSSSGYACTVDYASGTASGSLWWVDPETGAETEGDPVTEAAPAPPRLSDLQAFSPLPAPCQAVQDQFFARLP